MPWWWIYFREHLSIASFPKKTKYNTVQITYFLIKFADKTVSLKYRSSIFVNMGIVLMRMVNKPSPPTKHIHHSVAFANTAAGDMANQPIPSPGASGEVVGRVCVWGFCLVLPCDQEKYILFTMDLFYIFTTPSTSTTPKRWHRMSLMLLPGHTPSPYSPLSRTPAFDWLLYIQSSWSATVEGHGLIYSHLLLLFQSSPQKIKRWDSSPPTLHPGHTSSRILPLPPTPTVCWLLWRIFMAAT